MKTKNKATDNGDTQPVVSDLLPFQHGEKKVLTQFAKRVLRENLLSL